MGSYDPSKAPVMALYKYSSETSASMKNGKFLASWMTISVSKTILQDSCQFPTRIGFRSLNFYVTRNLPKSELTLPHTYLSQLVGYMYVFTLSVFTSNGCKPLLPVGRCRGNVNVHASGVISVDYVYSVINIITTILNKQIFH